MLLLKSVNRWLRGFPTISPNVTDTVCDREQYLGKQTICEKTRCPVLKALERAAFVAGTYKSGTLFGS